MFLAVPLFFARVFWYYSVTEKAAHDAARFLSTATQIEIKGSGFGEAPVAALARQIVAEETKEIIPGLDGLIVDVQCDLGTCGITVPATVRVRILMQMSDHLFGPYTSELYPNGGFVVASDVTMRYAGGQF